MNLNLFKNSLLLAAAVLYSANSFAVGGKNQTEMGQFEVTLKSGVKIKKQDRGTFSYDSVPQSNIFDVSVYHQQKDKEYRLAKAVELCKDGKVNEMLEFADKNGVSLSLKDLDPYYNPGAHGHLLVAQAEQGSVAAARLLLERHGNLYSSPLVKTSPYFYSAMNDESLVYCLLAVNLLKAGDASIFPSFMKFLPHQSYYTVMFNSVGIGEEYAPYLNNKLKPVERYANVLSLVIDNLDRYDISGIESVIKTTMESALYHICDDSFREKSFELMNKFEMKTVNPELKNRIRSWKKKVYDRDMQLLRNSYQSAFYSDVEQAKIARKIAMLNKMYNNQ